MEARAVVEGFVEVSDENYAIAVTTINEHCWHGDNICLTSNPPVYPETCCHCGSKRYKGCNRVRITNHGLFVGPVYEDIPVIVGGDGACVLRNVL